jgi:hypothetical protein
MEVDDAHNRTLAAVDGMRDELVAAVSAAVQIPSVNPHWVRRRFVRTYAVTALDWCGVE